MINNYQLQNGQTKNQIKDEAAKSVESRTNGHSLQTNIPEVPKVLLSIMKIGKLIIYHKIAFSFYANLTNFLAFFLFYKNYVGCLLVMIRKKKFLI